MESPLIRLALSSDAPVLAELCGQLGYPSSEDQVRARLGDILTAGRPADGALPEAVVFVADVDGVVAAWVHVFRPRLLESDGEAEIGGLVVDERFRRCGLGRALMDRAEAWAAETGCRAVRLRSNVVREAAHAFYEVRGYERVKSQHVFRRALRGAESKPP